jgi:hypothetical protein
VQNHGSDGALQGHLTGSNIGWSWHAQYRIDCQARWDMAPADSSSDSDEDMSRFLSVAVTSEILQKEAAKSAEVRLDMQVHMLLCAA